jgi:hypothetical protein
MRRWWLLAALGAGWAVGAVVLRSLDDDDTFGFDAPQPGWPRVVPDPVHRRAV